MLPSCRELLQDGFQGLQTDLLSFIIGFQPLAYAFLPSYYPLFSLPSLTHFIPSFLPSFPPSFSPSFCSSFLLSFLLTPFLLSFLLSSLLSSLLPSSLPYFLPFFINASIALLAEPTSKEEKSFNQFASKVGK